jgi:hypothetical protein
MKKHKISVGCLAIISLILSCSICQFSIPLGRSPLFESSLPVYRNSTFLDIESGKYGSCNGNYLDVAHYYWTSDPVATVRSSYEQSIPRFIESHDVNGYGNWLITSYNTDGTQPKRRYWPTNLGHGGMCDCHDTYRCISVALLDASQPEWYQLAVTSVTSFRLSEYPVGNNPVPHDGTIIILSYTASAL